MTKEVMQQALEFLEGGSFVYPTQLATDLREALAQLPLPVQPLQEPVARVAEVHMSRYTLEWTNGPLPEGTELFSALPEQEPVAWRDPTNVDPGQGCTYSKERREKWPHIYRQALYAAPPAAQPEQRKPLTDEEIQAIWDVAAGAIPGWSRHIAYARAIEAAHNIGGAKP